MSTPAPATGESTTEATTTETLPPAVTDTDTTDWKAEAEKWQTHARKHEDRAKANSAAAKELEQLRQQSMTDQEKAVAAAVAEARTATLREVGTKLVAAELRVATAGRGLDVDALLEGVDPSRFIDDEGEPDRASIAKWVDRIAPPDPDGTPRVPDLGQGARSNGEAMALNGDPLMRELKSKLGIR
jgi:hypothetical protein